jgi:hypothetical protein
MCIKFIAQDRFMEYHASVYDQGQAFEMQKNKKSSGAIKPNGLHRIANIG